MARNVVTFVATGMSTFALCLSLQGMLWVTASISLFDPEMHMPPMISWAYYIAAIVAVTNIAAWGTSLVLSNGGIWICLTILLNTIIVVSYLYATHLVIYMHSMPIPNPSNYLLWGL